MAQWKLLLGPWLNLLPVARSGQRQIAIQPPVLCTLYSILCISALLSCTLLVTLFSNTVICTLTTANVLFSVMFHRPGAYCHSMSGTWHRSSALPTAKVVTGLTTISQEDQVHHSSGAQAPEIQCPNHFWGLFSFLRASLCFQCSDKIWKYRGNIKTFRKKEKIKFLIDCF